MAVGALLSALGFSTGAFADSSQQRRVITKVTDFAYLDLGAGAAAFQLRMFSPCRATREVPPP